MQSSLNLEGSIIKAILNLPNTPLILQKINASLADERKKREQFYNEITDQVKAEYINGKIIVHSPVVKIHNVICGNAYRLLETYAYKYDTGFVGFAKILIQMTRNDYEPDVCFFNKNKSEKFKDDQKFFPVPDLIVEVLSKSTEKRDRGVKFQDYQAHGVTEYWIISPKEKIIEQYILNGKEFELITKSKTGEIISKAIKGLTFSVPALFERTANHLAIKTILNC